MFYLFEVRARVDTITQYDITIHTEVVSTRGMHFASMKTN